MSTGLDCRFREQENAEWTYELEDEFARGVYRTYGPFPSLASAENHLFDNHANPGGWTYCYHTTPEERYAQARARGVSREDAIDQLQKHYGVFDRASIEKWISKVESEQA